MGEIRPIDGGDGGDGGAAQREPQRWYHALLGLLVLRHVLGPVSGTYVGLGHLTVGGLLGALVMVGVAVNVGRTPRMRWVGLVISAPAVVVPLVADPMGAISDGAAIYSLLLMAYVMAVILGSISRVERVTLGSISGALSVYLLLAAMWTVVYALIDTWEAAPSFAGIPAGDLGDPQVRALWMDGLSYFSLVTLTTLGFGDVTPVSNWARTLTTLEAVLGQVFLVVLVARLVGLMGPGRGGRS